jgi:hypothetical protein
MKYIIAAIIALTAFSSSAQDLPRYATLYDCASWTRDRQSKNSIGPESYVIGFLAAQALEQLYTNKETYFRSTILERFYLGLIIIVSPAAR